MDATETLVSNSRISAVVLGREDDFALFWLNDEPISAAASADATARGLRYCGVIALSKAGEIAVELEPGDTEAALCIARASTAFALRAVEEIRRTVRGASDSAAWCAKLYALKDPRTS
jgi:hypothetical protein